ncbi:hypothetical protein [Psychromonas aquimarina]|uniref:hypothetical protein n=1 Tax=Psychromonas aquimarina TaxID=444919 RepID=UPI000421B5EE|nr:hypothetical protein [Psychromonas aquimarina]
MDYMNELLAQRAQFINTFYALKSNADDSRARLIACARLLAKKQHPFFSCSDIQTALSALQQDAEMSETQCLLMLQLYALIHQNPQAVVEHLYQMNCQSLQSIAPLFALSMHIENCVLQASHSEALLNNQLTACFYRRQWSVLSDFSKQHFQDVSALSQLYLTVLTNSTSLSSELAADFITCNCLHSRLFELYVVMLDERQLTEVVNHLSSDENNTALIINVMALSGYSKFIPFLARYLQSKAFTLDAHHALRILMGPSLDSLIPDAIQFESEEEQRIQNFTYYGAKILHYWDEALIPSLGERILAGLAVTPENLDKIWVNGSQIHRRTASLHRASLTDDNSAPYYACPEAVL